MKFKVIFANNKNSLDIERIVNMSIWRNNNFLSNNTDSTFFWHKTEDKECHFTTAGFTYDDIFIKRSAYVMMKHIAEDTRKKHPVYGNNWQLSYNIKNIFSKGTHTFFL
jgi:hypothetical protein